MPNSQTLIQRIRRLFREWHCSSILAAATLSATFAVGTAMTFAQQEAESEGVTVADIRIEGNERNP